MKLDNLIPLVLGIYAIICSGFSVLPSICGIVLVVTALRERNVATEGKK